MSLCLWRLLLAVPIPHWRGFPLVLAFGAFLLSSFAFGGAFNKISEDRDGWKKNATGWYYEFGESWLYHLEHGWLYNVPLDADTSYVWAPEADWWFIDDKSYPFVFSVPEDAWLYYQHREDGRYFWHMGREEWQSESQHKTIVSLRQIFKARSGQTQQRLQALEESLLNLFEVSPSPDAAAVGELSKELAGALEDNALTAEECQRVKAAVVALLAVQDYAWDDIAAVHAAIDAVLASAGSKPDEVAAASEVVRGVFAELRRGLAEPGAGEDLLIDPSFNLLVAGDGSTLSIALQAKRAGAPELFPSAGLVRSGKPLQIVGQEDYAAYVRKALGRQLLFAEYSGREIDGIWWQVVVDEDAVALDHAEQVEIARSIIAALAEAVPDVPVYISSMIPLEVGLCPDRAEQVAASQAIVGALAADGVDAVVLPAFANLGADTVQDGCSLKPVAYQLAAGQLVDGLVEVKDADPATDPVPVVTDPDETEVVEDSPDGCLEPDDYQNSTEPNASASVFNVQDYGAVGDGVADDTLPVRDAIAAVKAAGGGTVFFPEGVYNLAPQEEDPQWEGSRPYVFLVDFSNVTFQGEGADKSILSFYTVNMTDPETNWTIVGDGTGYFKIKRGGGFKIMGESRKAISNIAFKNLRLTGNALATGNNSVGGDPETGDGWDMSHKAVRLGGSEIDNVLFEDCHFDSWRGEILYAGGGSELGAFTIRRCSIYESNASAISMTGAVTIEDCQLWNVYNGTENFAYSAGQGTWIYNTEIVADDGTMPGDGVYGVVYIGVPGAQLVVDGCTISDFSKAAVFLSECAYDTVVRNSRLEDNSWGIFMTRMGLYPNVEASYFNGLTIENNDFVAVTRDVTNGVFFQLGAPSMQNHDVTIRGNRVWDENGYKFGAFISDMFLAPLDHRQNYIIEDNYIASGAAIDSRGDTVRALWRDTNEYNVRLEWPKRDDFDRNPDKIAEISPSWIRYSYNVRRTPVREATLAHRVHLYPVGFRTEIRNITSNTLLLRADPAWNTFTQDYELSNYASVVIEMNAEGLFDLLEFKPGKK